jgi:hypothetical protein
VVLRSVYPGETERDRLKTRSGASGSGENPKAGKLSALFWDSSKVRASSVSSAPTPHAAAGPSGLVGHLQED